VSLHEWKDCRFSVARDFLSLRMTFVAAEHVATDLKASKGLCNAAPAGFL